jgi:TfoX/Sxy family transcriptional regulator of competence genes
MISYRFPCLPIPLSDVIFHNQLRRSMPYSTTLANRIRTHLAGMPKIKVEEKEMFSGLAFLVNGKMCVNVSDDNLMCRFDPDLGSEVAERTGFQPMIMKGRQLKGYCYVSEDGYRSKSNFEYWLGLCLDFNDKAKVSKKKGAKKKQVKRG